MRRLIELIRLTVLVRLTALAPLVVLLVAGCGPASTSQPPPSAAAARPCMAHVDRGVLPEWARAGFGDPQPAMPHVLGDSGEIVAILFGDPLSSPVASDHANKILWVSHDAAVVASSLDISAQRMDGVTPVGEPVTRQIAGGPGPSHVDLPGAGCWRLGLTWADRSDSLDLEYVQPG